MRRPLCYGAIALMLCAGGGLAQQALAQQALAQQRQPDQATSPRGRVTAPDHTVPPTGEAQPQSPLADQAKPAVVGPSQANTAGKLPESDVPGATRQTMPSTISAENAAQDKLPTAAFQFPLTPEQKTLIAKSIAAAPGVPADPKLGALKLKVSDELPSNVEMQPFPDDVTSHIPEAAKYKYVKLQDHVLIIDPPNRTVVGDIHN